jgi:hypothetical protein
MSKKIINSGDYTLHVVNSLGGVIIVKVFERESKDLIECSIFTEVDETLEDYVAKFTNKTQSILNFLNTI